MYGTCMLTLLFVSFIASCASLGSSPGPGREDE